MFEGVVCDAGVVAEGIFDGVDDDGVDDDGTDGVTETGTDGVTATGTATGTDGVTETGTDGVTTGTDGVTDTGADGIVGEAAGRVVPVVGASCAGESLEAPPMSVVGIVTAGVGATIFETVDAAVAEPVSAPPPPHAASDVHSSVETTCTVTVREKSVMSVSSIFRRIGCVSGSSLSACQMP